MVECFECGAPASVEHHVVPHSLGGTKKVPLCSTCHDKVHSPESTLSLSRLNRRSPRGPAKMKEKEVRELLARHKEGIPVALFAKCFNITKTHAYYIIKGKGRVAKKVLTIS